MTAIRTSSTRARLSRRSFLCGVGASAALLPVLDAEDAFGAPGAYPKRLITIAWSNGVARPAFYPMADDPTANTIMQPLAPLKSKVTLVAGLDYKLMLDAGATYQGHGAFPTMFTGRWNSGPGPSIDQAVATAVAKSVNLPMPVISITLQGNSTSYTAAGTQNTGETQVARLYSNLFASQSMPSSQLTALVARRKSVIDYLMPELSAFSARRGADDRVKISAHLDSIRQVETSLSATAGAACSPVSPGPAQDYPTQVTAFSDLVALALTCDVGRSVTLTWAADGGSGPAAMPFLNIGANDGTGLGDVHAIAHQGVPGYPKKTVIDTWYMQQLAYLAGKLDAIPEGSGTLLDNSLIVMGNDMCEGSLHLVAGVPFILVGSAGGALRTGRTVKVGSWATATGDYWNSGRTGVPHNQLLASISNFMDVPVSSFGTGYTGTLAGL